MKTTFYFFIMLAVLLSSCGTSKKFHRQKFTKLKPIEVSYGSQEKIEVAESDVEWEDEALQVVSNAGGQMGAEANTLKGLGKNNTKDDSLSDLSHVTNARLEKKETPNTLNLRQFLSRTEKIIDDNEESLAQKENRDRQLNSTQNRRSSRLSESHFKFNNSEKRSVEKEDDSEHRGPWKFLLIALILLVMGVVCTILGFHIDLIWIPLLILGFLSFVFGFVLVCISIFIYRKGTYSTEFTTGKTVLFLFSHVVLSFILGLASLISLYIVGLAFYGF